MRALLCLIRLGCAGALFYQLPNSLGADIARPIPRPPYLLGYHTVLVKYEALRNTGSLVELLYPALAVMEDGKGYSVLFGELLYARRCADGGAGC